MPPHPPLVSGNSVQSLTDEPYDAPVAKKWKMGYALSGPVQPFLLPL